MKKDTFTLLETGHLLTRRTNNIGEIKIKAGFDGTPQRLIYSQDEINANQQTFQALCLKLLKNRSKQIVFFY
jgi:hypothetical protein